MNDDPISKEIADQLRANGGVKVGDTFTIKGDLKVITEVEHNGTFTYKPADCMICDLYKTIDVHLTYQDENVADLVSDLVSVLPPRGHGLHNLAIWQHAYRSRVTP